MTSHYFAVAAAFLLAGLAWTPFAAAQLGAPRTAESATSFSDAELKSFAGAVVEVQRIADRYRPQVEAAQTVRERDKLEVAASDELARAVQQEGLSVDRYQEILKQSLQNAEVAGRIKQHIKAKQ